MVSLNELLLSAADKLREAGVPGEFSTACERMAIDAEQPCVLAVVGRMKTGKSTFINTLLGQDLAKVGVTETTATINRFVYGTPEYPDRPVRCYFRGGRYEDRSFDFMNSLQGHDEDALRQSADIEFLEYRLPSPFLRQVTLVDTPGMSAAVDDHQNRTAEFLALKRQLRERNDECTRSIGSQADAVIYLAGAVARASDQDFLREFGSVTGGGASALNAIGVLAKIDLQPEIMQRRHELAGQIASQLREQLNTVVPVSGGLARALQMLQADGLARLADQLRTIPPPRLQRLLDNEEFWCDFDFPDCPLSSEQRRELLGSLDWGVFTTIARATTDLKLEPAKIFAQLDDVSGIGPLRELLERHFFRRSRFLRQHAIALRFQSLLGRIEREVLTRRRTDDRTAREQQHRFLALIDRVRSEPETVAELREFLIQQTCHDTANELANLLGEINRRLSRIQQQLAEENADFIALQALEDLERGTVSGLPSEEAQELRRLFGKYGTEMSDRLSAGAAPLDAVVSRQRFWRGQSLRSSDVRLRTIAQQAQSRYGLLLADLRETPNAL